MDEPELVAVITTVVAFPPIQFKLQAMELPGVDELVWQERVVVNIVIYLGLNLANVRASLALRPRVPEAFLCFSAKA